VKNTINAVFPHYKCFREGPTEKGSFQNMVCIIFIISIFIIIQFIINLCIIFFKIFFASVKPIIFRNPTDDDFMGSAMRKYMLESFMQWSIDLTKFRNITDIITDLNNPLDKLQQLSSFEHWNIMRN
jgi:hypothetical protein